MKKLGVLILLFALGGATFIFYQNLPSKRFAKHLGKARLFLKEKNYAAAREEYQKAYTAKGVYTPYVSLEVLSLSNRMSLQANDVKSALDNTRLFVKAHPDIEEGQILLAQLAFQQGELETAFPALEAALEINPYSFPARLLLTTVRSKQGRLDLAEAQGRILATKYPDSVEALLPLAEILLQENQTVESRKFLTKILAKDAKNNQARLLLVDSYLKERKPDSAQKVLDDWRDIDPEHILALQLRKAKIYSSMSKFGEAKAALEDFSQVKEGNIPIVSELAMIHVKQDQYEEALSLYQRIGDLGPGQRMGAQTMSFFLNLKNQNPALALETIKSMRVLDKRPVVMNYLLAAYMAIGQENKAREYIDQQPDSLKIPLNEFMSGLIPDKDFIGQWALFTYFAMNHEDLYALKVTQEMYKRWPHNKMAITLYTSRLSGIGAYTDAAKVLSTLPNPDLTYQLALLQIYTNAKQPEKTLALAEKLSREHPSLQGINNLLGDAWIKKDKTKVFVYYEKELVLNPENQSVLNNLAWEYAINQGNFEKAKPYFEKLKAKKSKDPRILDTVGWILASTGKSQEAEPYFRHGLDLAPDYPALHYHLGFILIQLGKKTEAIKHLDLALGSKDSFEGRKDAEKLRAQQGA